MGSVVRRPAVALGDMRVTLTVGNQMSGYADTAPESNGIADLASLLDPSDTSDEDIGEDNDIVDESTGEDADTDEDTNSQSDGDEDDEGEDADEDDEAEADPAPATEKKFKIPVKGENGEESTVEVDEKELINGYHRQADYTRKTQELAQRETQAVEFLRTKHTEVVNHYVERAELVHKAISDMAGIRSEAEMAQLAQSDPQAWVAESQRQKSITNYLSQLGQQIDGEKQRVAQEQSQASQQARSEMFQRTWQELSKEKIGKPELAKIYGDASKTYGFTPQELGEVYDHRIVKMMRDATAYQQLKSQKAEVTRKVDAAPRLPSKQAMAASVKVNRDVNQRFKSGRAKLSDLAAILN